MVDGRTDAADRRRTTDGRRLDGYTISSACDPKGSGELKSEHCSVPEIKYSLTKFELILVFVENSV